MNDKMKQLKDKQLLNHLLFNTNNSAVYIPKTLNKKGSEKIQVNIQLQKVNAMQAINEQKKEDSGEERCLEKYGFENYDRDNIQDQCRLESSSLLLQGLSELYDEPICVNFRQVKIQKRAFKLEHRNKHQPIISQRQLSSFEQKLQKYLFLCYESIMDQLKSIENKQIQSNINEVNDQNKQDGYNNKYGKYYQGQQIDRLKEMNLDQKDNAFNQQNYKIIEILVIFSVAFTLIISIFLF